MLFFLVKIKIFLGKYSYVMEPPQINFRAHRNGHVDYSIFYLELANLFVFSPNKITSEYVFHRSIFEVNTQKPRPQI